MAKKDRHACALFVATVDDNGKETWSYFVTLNLRWEDSGALTDEELLRRFGDDAVFAQRWEMYWSGKMTQTQVENWLPARGITKPLASYYGKMY